MTAHGKALMCAVAVACVVAPRPQGQGQSTAAKPAQYVEVDVRVNDSQGNPVRGLRKDDFRLTEDGAEQTIDSVTAIDLPAPPAATPSRPPAVPDVVTNTDHAPGRARFYVLLLDDRQIASDHTGRTIDLLTSFIEHHLAPDDEVAIVTTSGRTDMSLSFTSNTALLTAAVRKFAGTKPESIVMQRAKPLPAGVDARANETRLQFEHFQEAEAALHSLESICTWLAGIRGMTKSLLLVSEGVDYDDSTDPAVDPWAQVIRDARHAAIAAATRANVTVYAIDPRPAAAAAAPSAPSAALQREADRASASLRDAASSTGGLAFLSVTDADAMFDRIARLASSYYVIGYRPRNDRSDGRFRAVAIGTDKSDVQTTARPGYTELDASAKAADTAPFLTALDESAPTLRGTLNDPLPKTDMTLSASVVPFRGDEDHSYAVAAVVESPSVVLTDRNGKFGGSLEMIVVAINERNAIASGQATRMTFSVEPENARRRDRQGGFRTMALLKDLTPGRYEMRIATADGESGKQGSVWQAFELPDFWTPKLAMSGFLLASKAEGPRVLNGWMEFADAMPVPPTTVREFRAGDELSLFGEAYDNDLGATHQVRLTTVLTDADGKVAFNDEERVAAERFVAGKGAFRIRKQIPLTGIAPGRYVITVAAERSDDQTAAVRSIPITILQ